MIRASVITSDVIARPAVIRLLEASGFTVVGQGRTVADGQRLARGCDALVVDDLTVLTALATTVRRPLIGLHTDHVDPTGAELAMAAAGATIVLAWPAAPREIRAAAEQCRTRRPAAPPSPDRPTVARPLGRAPTSPSGDAQPGPTPPGGAETADRPATGRAVRRLPRLLVVGASAGGPAALAALLADLDGLPLPTVIAQHLHPAFASSLQAWLQRAAGRRVVTASDGLLLAPDLIALAGSEHDLTVTPDGRCALVPREGTFMPSIDTLLHSAATAFGPTAIGVILTGMGADGADGLLAMRQRGALTIAQDQATSAVYGMPAAAVRNGAAAMVLPLPQIPAAIRTAVGARSA